MESCGFGWREMRWLALLSVSTLALFDAAAAVQTTGEWQQKTVRSPGQPDELLRLGNGIYLDVRSQQGGETARYQRLFLQAGELILEALPHFMVAPGERRPDMPPDGLIFYGERNIREAWLAGPTRRYAHGVLGDSIEATALRAVEQTGAQAQYELPPNSVFEDRFPRLADLDGDGRDEIAVVRSYLEWGSALAIFTLERGRLRPLAETAPIGQPNRWLNPIGVGELDGDERPEIALVVTPHIGGVLKIYELDGRRLRLEGEAPGFSNHAIGSRELGMSLIIDVDGDGLDEIIVPGSDRKRLHILSFAGRRLQTLAAVEHPRPIATAIHGLDLDGDGRTELIYALDEGTVVVLTR